MADKCVAIIPAAGQGKRMNASVNKQFLSLQGMPVIVHTLRVFDECAAVDEIILVAAAGEEHFYRKLITEYEIRKLTGIVTGGRERQDSVYNGVLSIRGGCEIVIIHDGARPLITQDLILKTIAAAQETGAAVVCVPVKDTIKVVGENQRVKKPWTGSCYGRPKPRRRSGTVFLLKLLNLPALIVLWGQTIPA